MATLSKADLQKRYKLKNPQLIQHFLDQKKPVMLITGHYGNWEWGALALSAAFRDPVIVVYKPISDKGFEKLMNTIRSRFGAVMVAMKKTLRVLVSYKGQAHLAVFVGDQTPVKSEATFFTDFLNQRTAVFLGTEKLAKALGAPVVFGNITKTKRGYYESEFTLICDSAAETAQYEITSKHIALLEDKINKRPELWLLSHKRWKFKEEDTVE